MARQSVSRERGGASGAVPLATRLLRPDGDPKALLLCDHATNRIPTDLGALGLGTEDLKRHIAWDIGAADLTAALSDQLGVPAVLANFSRLVIDPNRGLDDPTLIPALSDGTIIPGNRDLPRESILERIRSYHAQYHAAVEAAIARAKSQGMEPVLLSIHSFTPVWKGFARPWHMGVLWNRDGRIARPLIARLRAEGDLVVGDNEPYSGELEGDCMDRHGTRNGLPHALIEIRQDLIDTVPGPACIAARLGPLIRQAIADAATHSHLSSEETSP